MKVTVSFLSEEPKERGLEREICFENEGEPKSTIEFVFPPLAEIDR